MIPVCSVSLHPPDSLRERGATCRNGGRDARGKEECEKRGRTEG